MVLDHAFFNRDTIQVARELLGTNLMHHTPEGVTGGRIVEVEAYLGSLDPASHSYRGQTRRNAAMFGPAGRAYIYFTYGMHWCFNVVTGQPGQAVLIRAIEPIVGIELMQRRRGTLVLEKLASGPARLVQATGILPDQNGDDLTTGHLRIEGTAKQAVEPTIGTGPRIGLTRARDLPLRFFLVDNTFVTKRSKAVLSRSRVASH